MKRFLRHLYLKQGWLIWFLPEGTSQVRSLLLPAWLLTIVSYLGLLAGVGVGIGGFRHYQEFYQLRRAAGPILAENRFLTSELNRLRKIERRRQAELDSLLVQIEMERQQEAQALSQVYIELARLKGFATDLKVLAGFKLPAADLLGPDQGGPELSIEEYYSDLDRLSGPELLEGLAERRRFLLKAMRDQTTELTELWTHLSTRPSILADVPRGYPVEGRITSGFGPRGRGFHPGVDIAAPRGTPVRTTADGVVLFAGYQPGYGRLVSIDHGRGYTTRYGHLARVRVARGDRVGPLSVIGWVGRTGRATGYHLHYEVRLNGVPVNPTRYLER